MHSITRPDIALLKLQIESAKFRERLINESKMPSDHARYKYLLQIFKDDTICDINLKIARELCSKFPITIASPAPAVRIASPAPAVRVASPAPAVRVASPAPAVRIASPAPTSAPPASALPDNILSECYLMPADSSVDDEVVRPFGDGSKVYGISYIISPGPNPRVYKGSLCAFISLYDCITSQNGDLACTRPIVFDDINTFLSNVLEREIKICSPWSLMKVLCDSTIVKRFGWAPVHPPTSNGGLMSDRVLEVAAKVLDINIELHTFDRRPSSTRNHWYYDPKVQESGGSDVILFESNNLRVANQKIRMRYKRGWHFVTNIETDIDTIPLICPIIIN